MVAGGIFPAEAAAPGLAELPPRKPAFAAPPRGDGEPTGARLPPRRPHITGKQNQPPPPAADAPVSPSQATASGRYELVAAIEGKGECGIGAPMLLSSLGEDAVVAIQPAATLSIAMYEPLEAWMAGVQTLAATHLKQRVVEVRNAADYVCRGRNNVKGARMSQHAFGRAFDIYGFRLEDGSEVTLTGNWGKGDGKGRFLKEVEAINCKLFKTALGPKADKHHRDHFHIDLGPETRKSHYCR